MNKLLEHHPSDGLTFHCEYDCMHQPHEEQSLKTKLKVHMTESERDLNLQVGACYIAERKGHIKNEHSVIYWVINVESKKRLDY